MNKMPLDTNVLAKIRANKDNILQQGDLDRLLEELKAGWVALNLKEHEDVLREVLLAASAAKNNDDIELANWNAFKTAMQDVKRALFKSARIDIVQAKITLDPNNNPTKIDGYPTDKDTDAEKAVFLWTHIENILKARNKPKATKAPINHGISGLVFEFDVELPQSKPEAKKKPNPQITQRFAKVASQVDLLSLNTYTSPRKEVPPDAAVDYAIQKIEHLRDETHNLGGKEGGKGTGPAENFQSKLDVKLLHQDTDMKFSAPVTTPATDKKKLAVSATLTVASSTNPGQRDLVGAVKVSESSVSVYSVSKAVGYTPEFNITGKSNVEKAGPAICNVLDRVEKAFDSTNIDMRFPIPKLCFFEEKDGQLVFKSYRPATTRDDAIELLNAGLMALTRRVPRYTDADVKLIEKYCTGQLDGFKNSDDEAVARAFWDIYTTVKATATSRPNDQETIDQINEALMKFNQNELFVTKELQKHPNVIQEKDPTGLPPRIADAPISKSPLGSGAKHKSEEEEPSKKPKFVDNTRNSDANSSSSEKEEEEEERERLADGHQTPTPPHQNKPVRAAIGQYQHQNKPKVDENIKLTPAEIDDITEKSISKIKEEMESVEFEYTDESAKDAVEKRILRINKFLQDEQTRLGNAFDRNAVLNQYLRQEYGISLSNKQAASTATAKPDGTDPSNTNSLDPDRSRPPPFAEEIHKLRKPKHSGS